MWSTGTKVAISLFAITMVILATAELRSDSFRIERTVLVHSSPEKIFDHVSDFHRWTEWSPYEGRDPGMKKTYDGPTSGAGSIYLWEGNREVGSGRMEIMEAVPGERITIDLDFFEPMKAHDVAEFLMAREDGGTRLTWAMSGSNSFPAKLFGLFIDVDRMVGKDFETGLAKLKALAEADNTAAERPRIPVAEPVL